MASPATNDPIVATIPELLRVNDSSTSNALVFSYTKLIWVPDTTSTTLATAPEVLPINRSPTTTLFEKVAVWLDATIDGRAGSPVPLEAKTPRTLWISGKFKQISSSSTLVPYAYWFPPLVFGPLKPLLKVVAPIPAPAFFDLLMIIFLHLEIDLSLDRSLDLLAVNVRVAFPVLERLVNVTSFKLVENVTWLDRISSLTPSCQVST